MEEIDRPFWPFGELRTRSPAALQFAARLAQRLDSVVPRPFQVLEQAGWILLYKGATFDTAIDVAGWIDEELGTLAGEDERTTLAERARSVATGVLDSFQDGVSEGTREPWPRLSTGAMAAPQSRVKAGLLYVWYGPNGEDEAHSVLSLSPISIAELTALKWALVP
jgi:hypothetical protein